MAKLEDYSQLQMKTILTKLCTVLLEKLIFTWLVKKFPVFYGSKMFVTMSTKAHNLSLRKDTKIHSIPQHHESWGSSLSIVTDCGLNNRGSTKTVIQQ